MVSRVVFPQTTGWTNLGMGLNGSVNAVTYFNGKLIAAGGFSGGIAQWDGNTWSILGGGLNDTVYALTIVSNKLYAGGKFTQAGSTTANNIAEWTGSQWNALGTGLSGPVYALIDYNSYVYAGGEFTNAGSTVLNNVGYWDNGNWRPCTQGVDNTVYALALNGGDMIAAGRFSSAGGSAAGKIAKWNGSNWTALGSATFNDRIFALEAGNGKIYAGGRFTTGGGIPSNYLAVYDGSTWSAVGGGVEDRVYALKMFNNELIVGGQHKFAGSGNSLYCNRISKWNGTSWSSYSTGMNDKVNAILAPDTAISIIAAGEFTTAGGRTAYRVASWKNLSTYTISGTVKYSGSGLPVTSGKVKAIRLDLYTREVLSVDSVNIQANGTFNLVRTRQDTVDVIAFPNDVSQVEDFVPTYYPSTLQWQNSQRVIVAGNVSNINIDVIPATPIASNGVIGGNSILNYLPAGLINGSGLPFKSKTIIYAKQGNLYRGFALSNNNELYGMSALPPGNYDIIVNRIGYTSASANVTLSSANNFTIDNLNFTLNPLDRVGVQNIGTTVSKNFVLHQNYPNPFNPETRIKFEVVSTKNVSIQVFDVLGKEVATLVNKKFTPGVYEVSFEASKLSSGIYFYKLVTDDFADTKKMILVR